MSDRHDPSDPRREDLPPDLDPRRGRNWDAAARRSREGRERDRPDRPDRSAERGDGARRERPEARRPGASGRAGRSGGLPPELDPRRSRGESRPPRTTTSRNRRRAWVVAAKTVAIMASVVVLIVSGALWALFHQVNAKVSHIDAIPAGTQNHSGSGQDIDGSDQNILLVGNDSRGGLTDAQLKEVGTQANVGFNTDTMLVVHVPADGQKATVVSLPRDSYVDVPGVGMTKLNAAYADGACLPNGCGNTLTAAQRSAGAKKLTATVSEVTGLHIDHYVEVGLLGFYNITKLLGGVEVCLKQPAHDPYSGIDLPAGRQTIEGTQALAFVRQRHGLPHGDLDRIKRQQAFLGAVADKVLSADTLLNPIKLKRLIDAVSSSLTVDKQMNLIKLAEQMRDLAAGNVTFSTMPTEPNQLIDGRDVLPVNKAQVKGYFDRVIGKSSSQPSSAHHSAGSTKTVAPSQVSVQVLNGSGAPGIAGKTQTQLQNEGFKVTGTGNADAMNHTRSEIHYSSGQRAQANTLAKAISGAQLVQDGSGSTLTLVLGSDFQGVSSIQQASHDNTGSQNTGNGSQSSSGSAKPKSRSAADNGCVY